MESYILFQFAADNASSLERSVAILLAHLEQPNWVEAYLSTTPHEQIQYMFFRQFIKQIETIEDLEWFRRFLQAANWKPDRWSLKAACDTGIPAILAILLELPDVEVDDWICLYVFDKPEFHRVILDYFGESV